MDENKNFMNLNNSESNKNKTSVLSEKKRIKEVKPKILYQKSSSNLSSRDKM